jgi:hypothetical protein
VILISHRGNLNGPDPILENNPEYIDKALHKGYNVEIDVWKKNSVWYLGHDAPQYRIGQDFFLKNKLWCHAKNIKALESLLVLGAHCFWHQEDDYTITNRGIIWAYPGRELNKNAICVLPESLGAGENVSDCRGICSDYIENHRGENG